VQLGTTLPLVAIEELDVTGTLFNGTSGNDSYDFRNMSFAGGVGRIVLNTLDGADTVFTPNAPTGDTAQWIDLGVGEDLFTGGSQRDDVLGGEGNDSLGGNAGADTLDGGQGNDTLSGGADTDRLVGGDGNDLYVIGDGADVVMESSTGGVDTVLATVTVTLADFVEVLNLAGASGGIGGFGSAQANQLNGNNADNHLRGLGVAVNVAFIAARIALAASDIVILAGVAPSGASPGAAILAPNWRLRRSRR
jgi:Ca2+-binding RTX toxin-like protein